MLEDRFPLEEIFEEGSPKPRKVKRSRRDKNEPREIDKGFELRRIAPKTRNQGHCFSAYENGLNLLLTGYAGTGKTFISIYLAMRSIHDQGNNLKKLYIVRSAVPSRDIGFLPGNAKDKMAAYEAPYQSIFQELYGRADAYQVLKDRKVVEFVPTSFIRGTTLNDGVVIVEECQNFSDGELNTTLTRLGDNTRLIVCGDYRQDDLSGKRGESSGFKTIFKILDSMDSISSVAFDIEDVVRSGFVKEYLLKRYELGLDPP